MRTLAVPVEGRGLRMAVIVSRFNHPVGARLLEGCVSRLTELGCVDVDVLWVPGAFEIPLTARTAAETGRYHAVITLGAVIRGDTSHFDCVCRGVTDGVREVALETGVPILFGVLTTDTVEQALDRAAAPGEAGTNEGARAAEGAVEMARALRVLRKD